MRDLADPSRGDLDGAAPRAGAPGRAMRSARLQRVAVGPTSTGADDAVDAVAGATGQPLPGAVRTSFERSLGADLGDVRVHTSGASADASAALGARAFTSGRDIHFAAGAYQPDDPFGLHLLGHEVAHTVQQGAAGTAVQPRREVSDVDDPLEVEADRAATAMVRGQPAPVSAGAASPSQLHRAVDPSVPAPTPDGSVPDLTPIQIEGAVGAVRIKGAIKFDSLHNGATIKIPGQTGVSDKLEIGAIEAASKTSLAGTKQTLSAALLNETHYLDRFPPPFEQFQPKLTGKLLDTTGELSDTKLLTVGFALESPLPRSLVPDWIAAAYKVTVEVAIEVAVTPTDMTTIGELRSLVDKAVEAGKDLERARDKVTASKSVVQGLATEADGLEALRKTGARALTPQQQSRLAQLKNLLAFHRSELTIAEGTLVRLAGVFERSHRVWASAMSKLSPLLKLVRGPLVEKLSVRLLPLLGKVAGKLNPILLIATTIWDLLHLAKFLVDLCQGRLKYVGLGGDYDPDLLDWRDPRGGGDGDGGDGDGAGGGTTPRPTPSASTDAGSTSTPTPTPTPVDRERELEALGGARTRLAHALLQSSIEAQLEPRHHERLIAILRRLDITDADVDDILRQVELTSTPDRALDNLEAYFARRDAARRERARTERTGSGDGDRDGRTGDGRTGDGDGRTGDGRTGRTDRTGGTGGGTGGTGDRDRRTGAMVSARIDALAPGADLDGGDALGWTARGDTAVITMGRGADGAPVTVRIKGRTEQRDGQILFYADQPGVLTVTTTHVRRDAATGRDETVEQLHRVEIPKVMRKPVRRRRRE